MRQKPKFTCEISGLSLSAPNNAFYEFVALLLVLKNELKSNPKKVA